MPALSASLASFHVCSSAWAAAVNALARCSRAIGRASNHWISAPMRGQDATLEKLRVDRQLEEAMVKGPDTLHLAEVFGLDEKTARRYADYARALLEQAAEQQHQ